SGTSNSNNSGGFHPPYIFPSMQPRVGRRDDGADGLLVEALVTLAALQVLEMAADGTLPQEPCMLSCVNPAQGQCPVGAMLRDRPPLARRECLTQEREIRERSHRLDAGLGFQAFAQCVEVELGLEMMHPGLENRLPVQRDPEPDRPRPGQVGKGLMGEILGG